MKRSTFCLGVAAMLYGAISPGANALAEGEGAMSKGDLANLRRLAIGPMDRLVFHERPQEVIDAPFRNVAGDQLSLSQMQGKVVLLNLWATWCPPCRAEMPTLDRLQGVMGGPEFQVVAISTDRGGIERVSEFFQRTGVKNLEVLQDPASKLALQIGILGLPITLILDRQGREIARLLGETQWDSREARVLIEKVIKVTAGTAADTTTRA